MLIPIEKMNSFTSPINGSYSHILYVNIANASFFKLGRGYSCIGKKVKKLRHNFKWKPANPNPLWGGGRGSWDGSLAGVEALCDNPPGQGMGIQP